MTRSARGAARVSFCGAVHDATAHADGVRLADGRVLAESQVVWLPPFEVGTVIALGINYADHAKELAGELTQTAQDEPLAFLKAPNTLIGHRGVTRRPRDAAFMHYECELAVVIGRRCKNVPRADALDYVLGYTCANDVSARDWQKEGGGSQWCRGKSFDTFCPLGPVLVTPDEIPNPNALRISTKVNGETLQDSSTGDMIFDVPALIEFLSGSTTLLPGTVILTGTPQGVGMARTPPRWLQPGDTVAVEIEKIGALTNPVVEERAAGASSFAL